MFVYKKRKVDMDADSVISAFIASSNQYVVCPNENNLMLLQRHLEIIDCLTTTSSDLGFFQNGNPLSCQCITHIVNLLLDTHTKCTLIPRALSILQNLSKCPQMIKNMQTVFHVHSAVSVFLQHQGSDFKDPLVLQCLDILENVTYDVKIEYVESHLENLINVLLKFIDSEASQLLQVSVKILSNLIRCNLQVQNHINSLPAAKQLIKRCVVMMNAEKPQVMVYALSILGNLTTNFSTVTKLFTENHLMTVYQLIIKLLIGDDESCVVAAQDLLLDLIRVPKYEACFLKSSFLNSFLKRVPRIFNDDCSYQPVVFLKILCALILIPDCCYKVFEMLCDHQSEGASSDSVKIHPKLLQWCTSQDISCKSTKLSLHLLKSVIKLYVDENISMTESSVKEVIKSLLETLSIPNSSENIVKNALEAHVVIFKILILLLKKTAFKNYITEHSNPVILKDIINAFLNPSNSDEYKNVNHIHMFLVVFEFLILIENDASNFATWTDLVHNNHTTMQFIAHALTSKDSDLIKQAMLVISLIKSDSIVDELSKNILFINTNLINNTGQNSKSNDLSPSSDSGQKKTEVTQPARNNSEERIDAVLSKIEKGLSIKDLKQSEIMDLYENKIAFLSRKEQESQNYIEVKTAALQKADQIMTQYKCRQAESDAEAVQLRKLVKEYERRCEVAVAKLEEVQQRCKKQKDELDLAVSKVRDFQLCEKEQNELLQSQMNRQYEQKKIFEEEKTRLVELLHSKDTEKKNLVVQIQQAEEEIKLKDRALKALEESQDESSKKIEDFKKSIEKMKLGFEQKQQDFESSLAGAQQTIAMLEQKNENVTAAMNKRVEEFNQQIKELEGEIDLTKEQLKSKEAKIIDLTEAVENLNVQLGEKNSDLKDAETSNRKLKTSLEENESKISKFEKQIKMLELLCQKYETSLEKKDKELKSSADELEKSREQCKKLNEEKVKEVKAMEAELENFKHLTGMINQLTSGKIPPRKHEK